MADDRYWILSGEETKGPYTLSQMESMWESGLIRASTLYCQEGSEQWSPVASRFGALRRTRSRGPSRSRGLAGALTAGIIGGGIIAGLAAFTGSLFTVLWWVPGWAAGTAARSWARTHDQLIGLFAFAGTFLGIFISCAGLKAQGHTAIVFGGLALLITLPGSLWLAFRTGSRPP